MNTKYAILSPVTGEYSFVDTLDDIPGKLAEEAFNLYMQQTHDAPISVVQTDETGAERWFTAQGDEFLSPSAMRERLEMKLKNVQSMKDAQALDVTTL